MSILYANASSKIVSITVQQGGIRKASFVGLLDQIGAGGVAVLLDGECLTRGDVVTLEAEGMAPTDAWVCHATGSRRGWRVGLSFSRIDSDSAEECWNAALCRGA